jgi:hypothetical protein
MSADGADEQPVPLQWQGWSTPLTWSPDSHDLLVGAGNDQHQCATLLVDATSGASTVLLQGATMLATGGLAPGETPHATGYPCAESATWSGEAPTAPTVATAPITAKRMPAPASRNA